MTTPQRLPIVDLLRGSAIVMMFVYHFSFDLNHYGLARFDFYHDPFWLNFRTLIVGLFLGLVGVSLHLATRNGIRWPRFFRRLGLIAGYAALVTLASWWMYPESFIFFGILHFIAVASVLGLAFLRFHHLNLVLGLALIAAGATVGHPFFDQPALQWFGLMTRKPVTQDYVPLVPWFGVVLVGLWLGRTLLGDRPWPPLLKVRARGPAARLLAWGGRHSLHIYILHQPVFFALLGAWVWLFPPAP